MEKKKMIAVLAITVMAVPLVLSGCGKDEVVDTPPTSDAIVESTVDTPVSDTIEEDLASEGIEVTPTPEATPTPEVEETETLDESAFYVTTLYAVGEISVFAEPSEDAEVIGTYTTRAEVSTLGILHEAEFYKVQYDETTTGYVRTVDLEDEAGSYDEETNSELVEETPETNVEEEVVAETGTETTPTPTDTTPSEPQTNNSLPADSNLGGLTDEEINAIMGQYGFPVAEGDSGYIPPEEAGEFEFGTHTETLNPNATIQ